MRSQQVQAAECLDGRLVSILYKNGAFQDKPGMHKHLWAQGPMKAFLPEGYPDSVTADYASTHISIDLRKPSLRPDLSVQTDHYNTIQGFSCGIPSRLFALMFGAFYQAKLC